MPKLKDGIGTDIRISGNEIFIDADVTEIENNLLQSLLNVDGSGSGLDADTVDGFEASAFIQAGDDAATLGSGSASDGFVLTADGSGGLAFEEASGGGGIEGTSYVFVAGNGTESENGTELANAYAAAKALTPYGNALSSSNRATVIVAPGVYDTGLELDTQFVDLVSLDGNRSVFLTDVLGGSVALDVTADNVFVRGINTGSLNINIADNLPNIVLENCVATSINNQQGMGASIPGTFIDCEATGDYGFAPSEDPSGTFINCVSGDYGFGGSFGNTDVSGFFQNCTAGNESFGTSSSDVSGTFENCVAGDISFAGFNTQFNAGGSATGVFKNCTAGDDSFGGDDSAGGIFENCVGGSGSFGKTAESAADFNGTALRCRLTSGTFPTFLGASGTQRLCLDGTFTEVNS